MAAASTAPERDIKVETVLRKILVASRGDNLLTLAFRERETGYPANAEWLEELAAAVRDGWAALDALG